MATAAPNPSTSSSSKPERAPMPTRNPLPLSSGQEQQVRELYYKKVRRACAEEIREFATCALNRTISATWACRDQRRTMNSCMIAHATREMEDEAREEWFATRIQRQRAREEKEKKRIEQEKFHREWWGLPSAEQEAQTREKAKTEKETKR
ncbi:hypothetical protein L228DRAFT_268530 [Xylona heveae TC161]|uniref:COX assembly mitochondrial protein n=1 Tax=Xylona heveae (strain CBS 132557 / TC161) TaxID=1328760 RepID=A0A165GCL9_XYLHT|nr:hypothetical protein L228DRAFT_268530 [Xylona heveae TC161]KZF22030.1 hypothetical protein L228DRAFT_268530 [Xylona heveae TC161]